MWTGKSVEAAFGGWVTVVAQSKLTRAKAERFAAEAGAAVHLVEGAGHAGVTDDRLDLRRVMRSWRDAG